MDSDLKPEFCSLAVVVRGSVEPQRHGARPRVLHPAATLGNAPHAELAEAHYFLASLVWQRVRPRERLTREARPGIKASYLEKANRRWIGASADDPPAAQKPALPLKIAHVAPLVAFPKPIETLLSQLARRRLPGFALRKGF